jgi:hypothetical protein
MGEGVNVASEVVQAPTNVGLRFDFTRDEVYVGLLYYLVCEKKIRLPKDGSYYLALDQDGARLFREADTRQESRP